MNDPLILNCVKVTIFTMMLAIGVNLSFKQLIALWAKPSSLLRLLLAVVFFVPLAVMLLLYLFPFAIAIVAILSLAIGHYFGGTEVDKRSALAIACLARNLGLTIYIAVLNNAQQVIPTLVSYAILAAFIAIPYSIWSKQQIS